MTSNCSSVNVFEIVLNICGFCREIEFGCIQYSSPAALRQMEPTPTTTYKKAGGHAVFVLARCFVFVFLSVFVFVF